jgi:hypothetical protein
MRTEETRGQGGQGGIFSADFQLRKHYAPLLSTFDFRLPTFILWNL